MHMMGPGMVRFDQRLAPPSRAVADGSLPRRRCPSVSRRCCWRSPPSRAGAPPAPASEREGEGVGKGWSTARPARGIPRGNRKGWTSVLPMTPWARRPTGHHAVWRHAPPCAGLARSDGRWPSGRQPRRRRRGQRWPRQVARAWAGGAGSAQSRCAASARHSAAGHARHTWSATACAVAARGCGRGGCCEVC
jgi:hypothetical protein